MVLALSPLSGVSAMLVFPSLFLLTYLWFGVSGQSTRCCFPGVILDLRGVNFLTLDGVVTDRFFLGDLSGKMGDLCRPSSKVRFLFTICLVFFGDLVGRFLFLALSFDFVIILPVVTTFRFFLSLLPHYWRCERINCLSG